MESTNAGSSPIELKQQAAERAVEFVESRMVVGLGSGTTALFAVFRLAEKLTEGRLHDVLAIPSSLKVEEVARRLGIPLTSLDERPIVHLTIDGADEVDPQLNLIKGGGGALLREKILAQASLREVIVVDESKLSPVLGTHRTLPVEVLKFGWRSQATYVESLGARWKLRESAGTFFETDQGNYVLDCELRPISDPAALAAALDKRAGIIEHGLFLGLATDLIVAGSSGVRHTQRLRPQS
jgi:ribose 5-phosphate isomerase A